MIKVLFISLGFVLLGTGCWLLGCTSLLKREAKKAEGVVSSVYLSAQKELICKLKGFQCPFRISHRDRIHSLRTLKESLVGKKVRILYADCWTPLDPGSKKDIAELRIEESVFFTDPELR